MSSRDHRENVQDQHNSQTEGKSNWQMRWDMVADADASHAAEQNKHAGSDRFREENRQQVQMRLLHYWKL